jgi:cytochrome c-type biogenesis protein CcmE
VFKADKILAKHDEEYMAPEVADQLAKHAKDKAEATPVGGPECGTNAS